MRRLVLEAPAKINLTLDIIGKRPDGYHDLQMVMQSISLCDTVTICPETGDGKISVSTCGADLPDGPGKLAWKAAKSFFNATKISGVSVRIYLEKRIPMQAGMAGGSTDAAAVLRGLRTLCCPGMSEEDLENVGAAVGSDVPFCVRGGTALADGRGERLTSLTSIPHCWIVVCKPGFGLPTPVLFSRVQMENLRNRPDNMAMLAALGKGSLPMIADELGNIFEQVLLPEEREEIFAVKKSMCWNGALNALMTGSGPTVFGLFDNRPAAEAAVKVLRERRKWVYLAEPI